MKKQENSDRELTVAEILDALLDASWQHVGEVRKLVHPSDTEVLRRLVEECDQRLERTGESPQRDRLRQVRRKLYTTAELNKYLPMVPAEDLARPSRRPRLASGPGARRPRSLGTGPLAPGFEAYHGKITGWLEEKGLSQNGLADYLDVEPSYLSRVIRGERKSPEIYQRLENLTGIASPYLTEDDEPRDDETGVN